MATKCSIGMVCNDTSGSTLDVKIIIKGEEALPCSVVTTYPQEMKKDVA
ncbi:hypothetical protein CCACVL1_13763 [Corchorus capsularis]|uniref:Uncharacterized protein n=1 Tax=Corchorus capsularis TaxID=210143 RepID=A0A1R3I9R4_COCAP|nr:hypothetical protein CCACVL1_13763 [Corchorus capsularis]